MNAVVLGVNGLVGRAIAAHLAAAGHSVTGTGRSRERFPAELVQAGVTFVESDRYELDDLNKAIGGGADLVVDCLCYTADHARTILSYEGDLGSAVMISSKAVYVDDRGRHGNSDDPPDFGGAVTESQPVMAPDWSGDYRSREGYGSNKVAAEQVMLAANIPVTVLRPSRIHGPGSARPREWFVVRRLLDGRSRIPLAHEGRTANHPTAVRNVAALVTVCAADPATRVLNVADPDAPTAAAVTTAVAAACGKAVSVVGLPDDAPPEFGQSPWSNWPPYLLDTTVSRQLTDYEPVPYARAVREEIDWLLAVGRPAHEALNGDSYFADLFDYAADDRALGYRPTQLG